MRPDEKHRAKAPSSLRVKIITISSSRYEKMKKGDAYSDEAGDVAESETKKAGHSVTARFCVSDDKAMIARKVRSFLSGRDDVLLLTGGTGVSNRDVTIETVRPFFEKELEGFGELLRRRSYDKIGSAAMLTRATAGVAKGKLILCMPGSPDGVRTALENFIAEVPHVLFVARN